MTLIKKINQFKNSFRNTIRVSNASNPDQDQQNVGPDLGLTCLQRSSTVDKSRHQQAKKQSLTLHLIETPLTLSQTEQIRQLL